MDKKIEEIKEDIQRIIRMNNQRLTDEQIEAANKEIDSFLRENLILDENESKVIKYNRPLKNIIKDIIPYVLHYYAFTQGNLELKTKLEDAGYVFSGANIKVNLYALDKNLSSKFEEDEYIQLLINQNKIIERFYDSLRFIKGEEREKYLSDFAYILHINPTIAIVKDDDSHGFNTFQNLLTEKNLKYFGKDFILNSTESQKKVINSLYFYLDDYHFAKIKSLLQAYPNLVPNIELNGKVLDAFSIEEIGNMSSKDANLYKIAIEKSLVDRMKELLEADPMFDCPRNFISTEIFKALDNETILGLTNIGKTEIGNIKIPKADNVIIIPVRKINRAVFRDKMRKKKMESNSEKSIRL